MAKSITLLLLLLTLSIAFAQKKHVQVDLKIDSLLKVINDQSDKSLREYNRKIDSANNAAYIQALERSNVLQAGNNAYYSWIVGGLTFGITVIVIIFGFNYFKTKSDFDSQLKKLQEHADLIQKQMSKTIAEQHDKIITISNELLKKVDEKVKEIDEKSISVDQQKVLKDIKEDVELVKNLSDLNTGIANFMDNIKPKIFAMRCHYCGKLTAAGSMYSSCTHCGHRLD